MYHRMIDTSFGLNAQSLAVLHLLRGRELEFLHPYEKFRGFLYTYPWYNGREKGVCLCFQPDVNKPCLVITFAEHRVSDEIFVDSWEMPWATHNPPTVADCTDEAYNRRKTFPYGYFVAVVQFIYDKLEAHHKKCMPNGYAVPEEKIHTS